MKVIKLILSFILLIGLNSFAADHWTEGFENPQDTWSSYVTGTITFDSGDWDFSNVYPESSGASHGGSSKACRINDDTPDAYITTPSVNSVGTITFWYRELNSGGGTFSVQKSVGGGAFEEITTQAFSGTSYTEFTYDVNDASNDIKIRIVNDDQAGHLIIDDFTLSDYAASGPTAPTLAISNIVNDKMNITWTKPSGTHGTTWDGVVIFVREGAANDATVTGTDGIDFTGNLIFGSGTQSGNSYCVARQTTDTDGDIVVTGLTEGNTYYVIGYSYQETAGDNNDDTWSDASTEFNDDAIIEEISSFELTPDNSEISLSWTNPTGTLTDYWDQVVILAKSGSAVDVSPSVDPSTLTANAAFGSGDEIGTGNFVVYKGTGTSETITSLSNGTEYYFEAFVYYLDEGSAHDYSDGVTSSATPNSVISEPSSGELIITELNSHSTANATYIELYNTTSSIISLDLVDVEHYNNGSATASATVNLSGNLDAGSYLIVARVAATFETEYPSVTADFELADLYVNGSNDGVAVRTDNNGIIDQFNDVPSATGTFTDNHLFYRVDFTTDGSSLTDHWADIGSNRDGTPKETNPFIWIPSGTADWNTSSNWSEGSVPGASDNVVIKDGTTQPTIDEALECNNLTVLSSATIDISPDYSITVNGDLDIDGTFTVNADATGMGSLITLGSVTGSIDFEIFTTQNIWWYTSPMVSGAQSGIYTATANDFYYWDEPGQAWTQINDDVTSLNACQGYAFRNTTGNETLVFAGTPLTGNQSIAVSSNAGSYPGFNLVGNPYPSAIDWETVEPGLSADIEDKIWYRTNGAFASWNGVSDEYSNGGQQYIPAGQGFWIKANAASTFEVNNDDRVHSTQAFYKRGNSTKPKLSVLARNGEFTDEAVLAFMPDATEGFNEYDTEKMYTNDDNYVQVWYQAENQDVAINILPEIEDNMSFPLGFRANVEGEYSIEVSILENFEDNVTLTLEDKYTDISVELKEGATFNFTSDVVDDMDRFVVHITKSALNANEAIQKMVNIYAYDSRVYVQNASSGSIEIYNVLGKLVASNTLSGDFVSQPVNAASGYYFVKVVTNGQVYSEKVYLK